MFSPPQKLKRIYVTCWIALLGLALSLDKPVATWVRDAVPVNKNVHSTHLTLETLKLPGWFFFTLGIAVIVGILHRRHVLAASALLLSGIVTGIFDSIIKWIVGRYRPVLGIHTWQLHPFAGGFTGLWREKGLCFPSGHASLAFATAMCLSSLAPRFKWIFFIVASITGAERVIENAHYLSDVVAGAGLGVCVAWIVTKRILSLDRPSL